jgi:hypothetical protein
MERENKNREGIPRGSGGLFKMLAGLEANMDGEAVLD